MPRPRGFDEAQALDAALEVFWTRGYEQASLPLLLQAMALSRSSFYDAFGSKRALFVRAVRLYVDREEALLAAELEARRADLALERLFELAVEAVAARRRGRRAPCRGCLVGNTASELAPHDAEIAALVREALERQERVYRALVERGQREGVLARGRDPNELGRYVATCLNGLHVLAKADPTPTRLRRTAELMLQPLR